MQYLKGLRPSGSMVVAIIALIVASAGTAVAAATITGSDIVNGAVTGKKVKDKSLKKKDLSKQVRKYIAASGNPNGQGPTGPQGPPGSAGANGSNGSNGASNVVQVKALVPDPNGDGPAPPAWGERVSTGCGGTTGNASVTGSNLQFDLPDAAGNDAVGASFNGYNGLTLQDISLISYHAKYEQAGTDQHGGTPYFRIFTEDFEHAVIFSPNTQPGANIDAGEWQKFSVTEGTVRYDDDGGNNPDISWQQLIDDHGDDVIAQIRIQGGCAGAYSADSVGSADDLTMVVAGVKSEFNFGN